MSDEIPAGEKPLLIPPAWFAIFFMAIYFVGRAMPGATFRLPAEDAVAGLLTLAGIGIAVWALVQFRQQKTTFHPERPGAASALVTDGVYKVTRNPMYVGMALILLALALKLGSLLSLLLVPVFIGVITAVQIIPEERALTRLFGDEFEAFKRSTPRWLFL
ncbi:methyltransferase family protein [Parvularcula mediterranea]|nr:isoprenylcysteine carboxylmethyltransferase family protein [Parvularcula mediterranea]